LEGFSQDEDIDITDRWLLTRINNFIKTSTECMENYKTPELVKAFEEYVDDISNWYVRSNRRRFWKQGQSKDKLAAYWCLYRALKSGMQVMAPVLPFMTEHIWQNMVRKFESCAEESVHLSSWPEPMPEVEDSEILGQTERVRDVIGLALKIRNEKQLKVKQPLSVMYVSGDINSVAAVNSMLDIVKDELNVKKVVFLEDFNQLNTRYLTLNFKKAGGTFKERTQELKNKLDRVTKEQMADLMLQFDGGNGVAVPGWDDAVDNEFFIEKTKYRDDISAASDKGISVALETELTEELILEGLYRELLRQCQLLRKEADLRVEQRIRLGVKSDSEAINTVVERYGNSIAEETLAFELVKQLDSPLAEKQIEAGGHLVIVQVDIK
jgi:isoleucyl-tRNA synthetase